VERMLTVVSWFLTLISEDQPDKKPYNPVIGETHKCSVLSTEHGDTKFYAEQVSHHPPNTAYHLINKKKNISILGNLTFAVQYAMNSVVCTTVGLLRLNINDDECYIIDKGLPDLEINNVIFGTRTMGWTGNITISCAKTNLVVPLHFEKNRSQVMVRGKVMLGDVEIYQFNGLWREQPLYLESVNVEHDKLHGVNTPYLLFDSKLRVKSNIQYPEKFKVPELNTFKVWGIVTEAIVKNDMNLSDIEKLRIETDQRFRIRTWINENFIFFQFDEQNQIWTFVKKKTLKNKEG